jgi:hypothetical protein
MSTEDILEKLVSKRKINVRAKQINICLPKSPSCLRKLNEMKMTIVFEPYFQKASAFYIECQWLEELFGFWSTHLESAYK